MTNYIYHPLAFGDYEDAINWYLEKSKKVAENFVAAINLTLQNICNHPERWRNTYKHYRELKLRKFPYIIVYTFEKEQNLIVIVAIHHAKKDPESKYR